MDLLKLCDFLLGLYGAEVASRVCERLCRCFFRRNPEAAAMAFQPAVTCVGYHGMQLWTPYLAP